MANLIVLTGLRRGQVFPVGEGRVVIGRGASAQVRLPDLLLSAEHAEVRRGGDGWILGDRASTNGTYCNGHQVVGEMRVDPGDVIHLGSTELLFTMREHIDDDAPTGIHEALAPAAASDGDDALDVRLIADTDAELLLAPTRSVGITTVLPIVRSVGRVLSEARDLPTLLDRIAEHFGRAVVGREVVLLQDGPGGPRPVAAARILGEGIERLSLSPPPVVRLDLVQRALAGRAAVLGRVGPDLAYCASLPASGGVVGAVHVLGVRPDLARKDLRPLFLVAHLAGVHWRSHELLAEVNDRNARLSAANAELEAARARLLRWNDELQAAVEVRTTELAAQAERLRLLGRIVEAVREGVVSTTLEGVVTSWNPGAEALYGYPAADVVGRMLPTLPDDLGPEFERVLAAVGEGRRLQLRTTRLRRDDAPVPIEATFAPVPDAAGGIVGLVELSRDLTAQLRTEEQLRWRSHMASFGELAAGLAHELGNPLANIRSGVEFLLARPREPRVAHESLELLGAEIDRLQRLVQQVLDLARWAPPLLRPVELGGLLDFAAAAVGARAATARVEVVRPAGPAVVANADLDQLKQVLLNLTSNAIEAMPRGGRLELATVDDGELVGVTVADTGVGIAPEHRARIFDLFFSRRPGGSGIGLAIVKRVIDLHRGQVRVESVLDVGTTITVLLPRAAPDAREVT